ncbi:MAG: formyltransferase family protein [Solirubrobacteraceae bacterium]
MSALRIAIVTGNPAGNAARICHHLARSVEGVTVVGAIVDQGTAPDRGRQLRRLRAWRRHGAIRYVLWRCWLEVRARIDPPPRQSYAHTLGELGEMFDFAVTQVPSVNSAEARDALERLDADLAVSVGNRVIAESTFSIPRLGTLNLHHGRIPDYRGGPPAFWELYDEQPVIGVSVHQMDAQLDHGTLLGAAEVALAAGDDCRAAMERVYGVDFQLMGDVVAALAAGTSSAIAVDYENTRVRTLPSRGQLLNLQARLGRAVRHDEFRGARLPALPEPPA